MKNGGGFSIGGTHMSEHVLKTIELFQAEIREAEAQLADKRKLVNQLCPRAGIAPLYPDAEAPGIVTGIRSDEFYGKPLATAVREVLQKRKAANLGAAAVAEIYDSLKQGGFHFQAKTEEYAKRGLYQSLTKNSATFHKLPNGKYGLLEWYSSVREQRPRNGAVADVDDEIEDEAAEFQAAFGSESDASVDSATKTK
jgi:hypothetical protein